MRKKHFRVRFAARCDSAEPNNGINRLLFTYRGGKQDQPFYGNFLRHWGKPIVGKPYWVTIEPAFPTDDAKERKRGARLKSSRRRASPPKIRT